MFLFKILLFNTFLLFCLIDCQELVRLKTNDQDQSLCDKKTGISFDLADLKTDYLDQSSFKKIYLEAFKSNLNDLILNERDESKYSQLEWFSIGYPKIELINLNKLFQKDIGEGTVIVREQVKCVYPIILPESNSIRYFIKQ